MFVRENNSHTNWFASDEQFNKLYPVAIRWHAQMFWTPIKIAKRAADFLAVQSDTRILDIGSGAGKFCLVAGHYHSAAHWYGIEQRKYLSNYSEELKKQLELRNVFFKQGNFTQINFENFDHFYFYNSFYENLDEMDRMDNAIDYSEELYHYYNRCLSRQLELKPVGTRLATLHSMGHEIPVSFQEVGAEFDGLLKFWIKAY
ncbi:MAG: methyltransferase [Bacteroidetes bacterium]|nr:MAG: methyltransferase [Bacteroidota bacterium]